MNFPVPHARPAYAPYGQPYAPPRYPLVSLVGAEGDAAANMTFNPLSMEWWRQRSLFGIENWVLGAGAASLGAIALAWNAGVFNGGQKGTRARRDFFSFGHDPARPRRRRRAASTTRRRAGSRRGRRDASMSSSYGGGRGRSGGGKSGGKSRDFTFFGF